MKIYEGNVFTINVEKIRWIISRQYHSQCVPEKRLEKEQQAENNECKKEFRLMSPDVWALSSCFTVNSRSLCLSNCEDTATRSYQRAPFIRVCSVKNTFTLQTLQTELMSRGVNALAGSPAFSEHSSVFLNSDSTPTFFWCREHSRI